MEVWKKRVDLNGSSSEPEARGSEQRWSGCDSNFLRALVIVVLQAIHARADWIFFHQSGIEGCQATGKSRGVLDTRIQPTLVIVSLQNRRHAAMNVGDESVWGRSQDCA